MVAEAADVDLDVGSTGSTLRVILQSIELQSATLARVALKSSWSFGPPQHPAILFHVLHHGSALVRHGQLETSLSAGDTIAILSESFESMSDPTAHAREVDVALPRAFRSCTLLHHEVEPGGAAVRLSCGAVYMDPRVYPVLALFFPSFTKVGGMSGDPHPLVAALVSQVFSEVDGQEVGSEHLVAQLLETLLFFFAHKGRARSQIGSVEPSLLRAVLALHSRPHERWTVQGLAHEAGMSRASLARRFARVIGTTPMQYLEGIRIQRATVLLRDANLTVAEVSVAVGYNTPEAFSRAFRRTTGLSPRGFRARWR